MSGTRVLLLMLNGCLILLSYLYLKMRSVMNTSQPHTKTGLLDQEINFLAKMLFVLTMALALVLVSLKVNLTIVYASKQCFCYISKSFYVHKSIVHMLRMRYIYNSTFLYMSLCQCGCSLCDRHATNEIHMQLYIYIYVSMSVW